MKLKSVKKHVKISLRDQSGENVSDQVTSRVANEVAVQTRLLVWDRVWSQVEYNIWRCVDEP
jgi:hypothetical protein